MARKKKLKPHVVRLSKRLSIPEKVQNAVKRSIMDGLSLIGCPSTIQSTSDKRNFLVELRKYTIIRPSTEHVCKMVKINDAIGVGVVATAPIKCGLIIPGMWGATGRRIDPDDSIKYRSSVRDDSFKGPPQYRVLNGPISMLNYACLDHANCVTNFAGKDSEDDFKVLQACKKIKTGTELTICYSEESYLVCRMCK